MWAGLDNNVPPVLILTNSTFNKRRNIARARAAYRHEGRGSRSSPLYFLMSAPDVSINSTRSSPNVAVSSLPVILFHKTCSYLLHDDQEKVALVENPVVSTWYRH